MSCLWKGPEVHLGKTKNSITSKRELGISGGNGTGPEASPPGRDCWAPPNNAPCFWPLPPASASCPAPWRQRSLLLALCPVVPPLLWPPVAGPCRGLHSAVCSPAWPCADWPLPLAVREEQGSSVGLEKALFLPPPLASKDLTFPPRQQRGLDRRHLGECAVGPNRATEAQLKAE